jgi:phosphoribosylanthranilate isomerase
MIRFSYKYWNLGDRGVSAMLKTMARWLNENVEADLNPIIVSVDSADSDMNFIKVLSDIKFVNPHKDYEPAYAQMIHSDQIKITHVACSANSDYWMDLILLDFEKDEEGVLFKMTFPKELIFSFAECNEYHNV